MTTPVLTEDTLKALDELLGKGTPGKLEPSTMVGPCSAEEAATCTDIDHGIVVDIGEGHGIKSIVAKNLTSREFANLICAAINNLKELLRGYRLGIALDKDRKP